MKKGFTLAEVLITLTIIGVVAAVTLPSLQNNVNKQALEKQTLKFYNTIVEAHDRYLANNHLDNINAGFIRPENIRKYFNVVAQSEPDTFTDYFADEYSNVNGDKTFTPANYMAGHENVVAYKLADGTVFAATYQNPDIYFIVDVNGTKGPNVNGYDMWGIKYDIDTPSLASAANREMVPDQVVGVGAAIYADGMQEYDDLGYYNNCISGTSFYGCFGHFMRNGFKFDY